MADPDSTGFCKSCIDQDSLTVLDCSRNDDGRSGRVVIEMQITEKMANLMGNLHGQLVPVEGRGRLDRGSASTADLNLVHASSMAC